MPARQRGSIVRLPSGTWSVRYYNEGGKRSRQSGFQTRSEAGDWLDQRVKEVAALRRGDRPSPQQIPTVDELIQGFLATHEVDPATTDKLRYELVHARRAFGDKRIDLLTPLELSTWRGTLPAGSRQQLFRAFNQVLEHAVTLELLDRNPCARIKNKAPALDGKRQQMPFQDWNEVEAICDELDPRFRSIPVVLVGTGLRPEELFGLERRDLDRANGILNVERVYSQGRLKPCKKSDRQRRRVPLRARVLEALDAMPPRIDTPLLFASARGIHIDLGAFRDREWTPALRAAGLEHRGVYSTRHTFATWSIAAGMHLYVLARTMGCSIGMIDQHYGHLLRDNDDYVRGLLDNYDAAVAAS